MKKQICCFLPSLIFSITIFAQAERTKKTRSSNTGISVGVSFQMPFGVFSHSHNIGAGIDVSPANHTFGLLNFKKIAFTYNGGIAHYWGREVRGISYYYKYPGFTFIHAFGGVLYNPLKKLTATLLAGPALGIYKSRTRFNIGTRLEGSYYIRKTSIAAGPLIHMMVEPGTKALWTGGLKVSIDL